MDERDFSRVLDQVKPSPAQKQAMLDRLLAEEGKKKPMKYLKRTVVFIAAALILITCVTAVQTSVLDPRMLEYYGLTPEQEARLLPAAVVVEESHTYENGWTVEIKQVVSDLWYTAVLCEITAPEGVVLEEEDRDTLSIFQMKFVRLNENGHGMGLAYGTGSQLIEDDSPNDNHMTVLCWIDYNGTATESYMKVGLVGPGESIQLCPQRVIRANQGGELVDFTQEEWSYTVKLPAAGRQYELNQHFKKDGVGAQITNVYISPRTVNFHMIYDGTPDDFDPAAYDYKTDQREGITLHPKEVSLQTRDGRTIPMFSQTGIGNYCGFFTGIYWPGESWPGEIIDPAEVTAITISGQTYDLRNVPYHME